MPARYSAHASRRQEDARYPWLTMGCMVGPARGGRAAMRAVDAFLADLAADVEPITHQVASRAAQLRAQHGARLRLPDALIVATALHLKADRIITADAGWPRVGVTVELLRPARGDH